VRAVRFRRIGWHPDDPTTDFGSGFHGQRVQATDFCVEGQAANQVDTGHHLADREGDGCGGIFVALENQPAHSQVLAMLGNLQGVAPPFHLRVGFKMDVDINCAFQ
jgi:lactam utilization protein B